MYCADTVTPSEAAVDFDTTTLTGAFFATAPAHSTSSVASAWSLESTPGSGPFRITVGRFDGRPIIAKTLHIRQLQVAARHHRDAGSRAVDVDGIERADIVV